MNLQGTRNSSSDNGKPGESRRRKAMGLKPHRGNDCQVTEERTISKYVHSLLSLENHPGSFF